MRRENPFKKKIKLYKSFIKENKIGTSSFPFYKQKIKDAEKILKMFSEGKMTPKKFDKLTDSDKWEIVWGNLLKGVMWCCNNCGLEQGKEKPHSPFFEGDSIHCSDCDNMLSNRTGGGQSNVFNYTYKKIKKRNNGKSTVRGNTQKKTRGALKKN